MSCVLIIEMSNYLKKIKAELKLVNILISETSFNRMKIVLFILQQS